MMGELVRGRRGGRAVALALALVVLVLLEALPAAGSPERTGSPAVSLGGSTTPVGVDSNGTAVHHVVVVIFENVELSDVLANGPYERYLAEHYAFASQYYAVHHSSLSQYIVATSGASFNYSAINVTHVGDLAESVNLTWAGYFESMPSPCYTGSAPEYDPHHNPFLFYTDVVSNVSRCDTHDLNFSAWNETVANGTLPSYSLVVPNLVNDGWATGVAAADSWLHGWLPPLINSSLFRDTAFLITYDEGTTNLSAFNGSGGGHIYFVAVSPYARPGYASATVYSHYNLLTTTEWLLGLPRNAAQDSWTAYPPMKDLFSFSPMYQVEGRVQTNTGHGISNASVTDVVNGSGTTALSGADGSFSLVLSRGNYSIEAAAAGYAPSGLAVSVQGYNLTDQDLVLSPLWLPTVAGPFLSPPSIDIGQAVRVSVNASTWIAPLRFAWSGLPPGCSGAGRSLFTCQPTVPGTYDIAVVVSDTTNVNVSLGPVPLVVFGRPTIDAVLLSPPSAEVGTEATFAADVTGGSGVYTFGWSGLPSGCLPADARVISCVPNASGSFAVSVRVTDSLGGVAPAASVTVLVAPSLNVTLLSPVASITLGDESRWVAVLSGGVAPFTFNWTGLPPNCRPFNASVLACVPGGTGDYEVRLTVTDAAGAAASSGLVLTVVAARALAPGVATDASAAVIGGGLTGIAGVTALLVVEVRRQRRDRRGVGPGGPVRGSSKGGPRPPPPARP